MITTGSVKRMDLQKGDAVVAIIKTTEVSVEEKSANRLPLALAGAIA
jgi:molybdopterin-binding protein